MHAEDKPIVATVEGAPVAPGAHGQSGLSMALDFGPLLLWFGSYWVAKRVLGSGAEDLTPTLISTAVFMAAILVALIVSKVKLGKVSPMLWLSAVLVIFFGSLTLYFRDPSFIMAKPTYIYGFFALLLIGGWIMKKPLMRYLLQSAFHGLDEAGWLKYSRNWGLFFIALALTNEVMRHNLSYATWLTIKVWGMTALTFLFGVANMPMMLRHGLDLGLEETKKAE
jgi:intracellular septation protein